MILLSFTPSSNFSNFPTIIFSQWKGKGWLDVYLDTYEGKLFVAFVTSLIAGLGLDLEHFSLPIGAETLFWENLRPLIL